MESQSVDNTAETGIANSGAVHKNTSDAGAPKTPGSTETSQTHNKSTESVQIEVEVEKHNDSTSLSKTDSIQRPHTSAVQENVAKTSKPEQVGKSMIADRIAFEEPIVTDIEFEVPILDNGDSVKPKSIFTEVTGPTFYNITSNLVTPPIIIKNLPEQFVSLPVLGAPKKREDLPQFYNDKIRDFVGDDLTDEEFEKLAKYCSPDHLRTGEELSMPVRAPTHGLLTNDSEEKIALERSTKFSGNTNLCIHKKYQLRVDKDLGNHYIKRLKYRGVRLLPLVPEDGKTAVPETESPDLEPGKDLVLRVRVYRPYDYNIKYFRGRSRHAVFNCDIILTGKQKLTALRDRIVCANDVGMRVDVSCKPDDQPASSAKEVFPSGFLFINNVFYVDTRAGCADHAAGLRDWAKRRGLGDFPSEDMCTTTLEDMVLRLGFPEVYVHQGNCEHLFTFSSVRLLAPADPLRLAHFPANSAVSSHQSVYCTTCAEFGAKWIVVGCTRVPFDPAFFCDTCFKLYLYKDGKKIGDFKAYSYRGNEMNMLKPQG